MIPAEMQSDVGNCEEIIVSTADDEMIPQLAEAILAQVEAEVELESDAAIIEAEPPVLGARLLEVNIWLLPNGHLMVEGLGENAEGESEGFGVNYFHSEWQLAAKLMELTGRSKKGLVRPWSKTQTIEDWIAAGNQVTRVELPKPQTSSPKEKLVLTMEDLGL